MNQKRECSYSNDEILYKAIELIKNGAKEEDIQMKYKLTTEDMDLIDFVINEF